MTHDIKFIPWHWRSLIEIWLKFVCLRRLLFLMDAARAMTVIIWLLVLITTYFEIGRLKPTDAAEGMWPQDRLSSIDRDIKQLREDMADESRRTTALSDFLIQVDKRIMILDERQQIVIARLNKSEAFWENLKDKFWWAIVGQVGVLLVWFFLGRDLKQRIHSEHDAAIVSLNRHNSKLKNRDDDDEDRVEETVNRGRRD